MDREIKFRAWNKKRQIMCYDNEDNTIGFWDGCFATNVSLANGILSEKEGLENYEYMQFIGIKDKNVKEIYEGDIVEIIVNNNIVKRCVVEFKNGIFGVMFDKQVELTAFPHFHNTTFEVIGNIYENLELLKESEE